MELVGEHVVGIVAKAGIAKGNVGRVREYFLAISTKFLHPDVGDPVGRELLFQRLTTEVGQAARCGEGANIDKSLDMVSLEGGDEFCERTSGVADGEERASNFEFPIVDCRLKDPLKLRSEQTLAQERQYADQGAGGRLRCGR